LPQRPSFPIRRPVIAFSAMAVLLFSYSFLSPIYNGWKMNKAIAQASHVPRDYPLPSPIPSTQAIEYNAVIDINQLLQRYPGKMKIAATEYGYLGASNPDVPILDLCGLHNKEIATKGYNDSILAKFSPDLIWMCHTDYTALYRQIVKGTYFQEAYEFHPELLVFGLAIKRSSPYYVAIKAQLGKD
jgi:hypothetical protein